MIGAMLGKSISEINAMPNNEVHMWRAFIVYRQSMLELAAK